MNRHQLILLRVRIIMGLLGVVLVVLTARAVDLQLFKGDVLRELADRQHSRTLKTLPQRGEIVDRNGEELAVSMLVDSAYANPAAVTDAASTARTFAAITGQDRARVERLLSRKGNFVWLDRLLEPKVAERLRAADLPGIGFVKESKRYYPNGHLMGQALGFVGLDAIGLEGIERQYDKYIRGESAALQLQRDALNRGILTRGAAREMAAGGYRLELTIDKGVTYEAQKALDAAVAKYKAKDGIAIAQDVETGAILAMVVSPPFDPNHFERYPVGAGRNRAVADVYEPGSTIKTFVLAAALQEKLLDLNTIIFCENGEYQVADRRIRDTHPHGWITASQVVKYSSNIGALKVSRMLGSERWYRYLQEFGFTERSGIDLPGEARGLLRPVKQWNEVLLATTSYGQGMGSSPLQVLNAMTAVANGGRLMKPYVVSRIVDTSGRVMFEAEPEVRARPISAGVAAQMRKVLESVVEDGGTGMGAAIPGFKVAGKTGTAQKVDPATGLYSRSLYVATFVGFLPSRDPRVAIIVSLNEPPEQIYGGIVAAPVFGAIGAKAMERLRVPPDYDVFAAARKARPTIREAPEALAAGGSFEGLTLREALAVARQQQITLIPRGSGLASRERCGDESCEVVFRPL